MEKEILVSLDSASLDEVMEKANRLVGLLSEAAQIIDSLSSAKDLEP